jgi:hypothetical protein
LGIGDWGLGIGDWAQSPIPNPQSPIPNPQSPIRKEIIINISLYYFYLRIINNFNINIIYQYDLYLLYTI